MIVETSGGMADHIAHVTRPLMPEAPAPLAPDRKLPVRADRFRIRWVRVAPLGGNPARFSPLTSAVD